MRKEKVVLKDSSGTNSDLDVTARTSQFDGNIGANLTNNISQPTFQLATGRCDLFDHDGTLDEATVRKYDRVEVSHSAYSLSAMRLAIREVKSRLDGPFVVYNLQLVSQNISKSNTTITWTNTNTGGDFYINALGHGVLGIRSLQSTTSTWLGQNTTGVYPLYRMCSQMRELNWTAWMRFFQWLADCIIVETEVSQGLHAYFPAVDTRAARFTFRTSTHNIANEIRIVNQYRWRRDYQQIEFIRDNVSPRTETDVTFQHGGVTDKTTVYGKIPLTWPDYPLGFDWYHINTAQSLFSNKVTRYATKIPLVVEMTLPMEQPTSSATNDVHALNIGDMIEIDLRERTDDIALRGKFVVLNKRVRMSHTEDGSFVLQCLLHGDKLTPISDLEYLTWKAQRITWKGDRLQWMGD